MDDAGTHRSKDGLLLFFGGLLTLVGIALSLEGTWLISVGGNWYYTIAGIGMILSGIRHPASTACMIGFMWSMYKNKTANAIIVAGSVVVFAVSLWLVRSQETVYDVSYMEAMVPHHSIAIMTSERAHIRDPRVRKLADGIIEAQVREIDEMKMLIADLKAHPLPTHAPDLPSYRDRGAPAPAQ